MKGQHLGYGDEGLCLPNCPIDKQIWILSFMSQPFRRFINATAYHLWIYLPISPTTTTTTFMGYPSLNTAWPDLGIFKVLGDKICNKSCPNDLQHFGQFWKTSVRYAKTTWATFGSTFGNIWAIIYSNIWSHTVVDLKKHFTIVIYASRVVRTTNLPILQI